jgi:hypothetical protein
MLVAQPQPYPDAPDQDVEQGRGVARVSVMNGEISMQRGDSGEWVAAVVNAPLLAGDAVATGRGSRGEIQFDADNALRLGENTQVRLASLDGGRYQLQISNGLVTYRVLRTISADVEINTPAVAVRPLQPGSYRIEVQPNGETMITVRSGEAEIFSNQGSERLGAGRTMLARPSGADGAVDVQELNAIGLDEWDRWNQSRDTYVQTSQSYNYVPPGVYGAEDLDRNGDWRPTNDYGEVWFPRVAADWAPYSNGRWVWSDWYGWTWVSYDSWGWAPFHYGRWYRDPAYGWGWYPGQRRARAYWSPALVGFFGWGGRSGVSVGFGYGNIGWVPLAPGERFYPWYGSRYYGARGSQVNVNIYNVNNIRGAYRNANVNGAVLSTGAANFGRGQTRAERVNIGQVGNVGQIRGQVPIVPAHESLRFNDRVVTRPAVAQSDRGTRFVQRQAPARVERVPFEQQRQQMGRQFQGGGAATSAAPAAADSNWRRFGDQGVRSAPPAAAPDRNVDRSTRGGFNGQTAPAQTYQQTPDRSGNWRRFGDRGTNSSPALAPQATPQVSAPAAPAYQGPGPDRARGSQMQNYQPQAAPSFRNPTPAPAPQAQQPQPQQWRQPAPERYAPPRGDNGGGGRPLQLNRPIIQERAPQSSGAAPARGNSGSNSGGNSGNNGHQSGRQSEHGSDHGRR